ncbi:potassium channel family protein [Aspergillus lucknowensis]|uniref:Potassium channel domain-containing protein n=1 Tax=Aspergillus lucknowensis TaxID=176173 RepID=A0ABR4LWU8_9EURO
MSPTGFPTHIESDNSSRWWFASTAFPMIAGTLGPVASAFSICALASGCRQHLLPGTQITSAPFIKDPKWHIAINASQLAIAVVANVFLLLNMARRIRFNISQPATIVGWYISSICWVALAATGSGPLQLQPSSQYIWSQAFYYGIYAAVLYFICASVMVVTFWGAQTRRYSRDFELTASQRTLMLQTIMFLIYLLVGALVFATIEGWSFLDAVYFADVTLFTVGFGDFAPKTTLGRALLVPYTLIGVISLGLVIGSIRELMLDLIRRRLEAHILQRGRNIHNGNYVQRPVSGDQELGLPSLTASDTNQTGYAQGQYEYSTIRQLQEKKTARRQRWLAMGTSTTVWLVLWLVAAGIFESCEKPYHEWTYFTSFYFCFISLTTVGYGDVSLLSNSGKSFFVFWSTLALPATTVMISDATDTLIKAIRDATNFVGGITILPEQEYRTDFREFLRRLLLGKYRKSCRA